MWALTSMYLKKMNAVIGEDSEQLEKINDLMLILS